MSKVIEKPYDVLIAMSAKIIHDFKINESDWPQIVISMSSFLNSNVKNMEYAKKIIKMQLTEVEGDFYKKYSNNIKTMPDFKKCYCKLVDWVLQLHLKRVRLMKAKHKNAVAKHILSEEMLVANKFFINQDNLKNLNIEKIIDISIENFIKK
jgi:hypothetical protein